MGDGHLGKCKSCTKRDTADRVARKMQDPQWVEAEMERHRVKSRLTRAEGKAYIVTREEKREIQKRYRKKYPEKNRARLKVQDAKRAGKMKCEPCSVCGATRAEAHHDDYSKPLDVVWLCTKHHAERHVQMRREARMKLKPI